MANYHPSHNYGPEHAAALAAGLYDTDPKRPTSPARIEANRLNAQKSTGPRTEEGKAASSLNAFRHGLTGQVSALTEEDRAAEAAFTAPIIEDLKPEGSVERQIAIAIARGHWRLNRICAMEDNVYALGHFGPAAELDVDKPELHGALTHARVFLESSKDFERLTLYEQRIHRNLQKDMAKLKELQSERKAEREAALEEAAKRTHLAEFLDEEAEAPEVGFDFSNEEIAQRIARNESLKRAEWYEERHWHPESRTYPADQAA